MTVLAPARAFAQADGPAAETPGAPSVGGASEAREGATEGAAGAAPRDGATLRDTPEDGAPSGESSAEAPEPAASSSAAEGEGVPEGATAGAAPSGDPPAEATRPPEPLDAEAAPPLTPAALAADSLAADSVGATRADRLELALDRAANRFDPVVYLSAQRAMLVALFEGICAFQFLVPPDDRLELGLGLGCLVGAATLTYVAWRGFRRPRSVREARERLVRFRDARAAGAVDLDAFEAELAGAAARDLRKRRFAGVFGVLNLVATVVLSVLTARDRVDRNPTVAIATGTAAVGILGVTALFVEGASERAFSLHRRF